MLLIRKLALLYTRLAPSIVIGMKEIGISVIYVEYSTLTAKDNLKIAKNVKL
jgi:hypothetical protein